ncbi:MAG: hypothetical protein ACLU38_05520 [Dysosmobacter sp.]
MTDFNEIDDGETHILLCHYPMLYHKRGYMIHGHLHHGRGRDYELLRQLPRVLNAGVDVNRYRPVTLAELVENNGAFYAGERDDSANTAAYGRGRCPAASPKAGLSTHPRRKVRLRCRRKREACGRWARRWSRWMPLNRSRVPMTLQAWSQAPATPKHHHPLVASPAEHGRIRRSRMAGTIWGQSCSSGAAACPLRGRSPVAPVPI